MILKKSPVICILSTDTTKPCVYNINLEWKIQKLDNVTWNTDNALFFPCLWIVCNYWHRFLWGLFVPAARLLRGMRRDIDPCDDFFEYACGSWNKINVIPEDRSGYNTFAKLRDDLQVILKGTTCFRVALSLLFNINNAIWLKNEILPRVPIQLQSKIVWFLNFCHQTFKKWHHQKKLYHSTRVQCLSI